MKALKRFALWSALLTKRLIKKPVFPILLLCVPLLCGAMALAARQDSGVVTVALVCATENPIARRSADRLLHANSLVRCVEYADETEARAAVEHGNVDAAWIFREEVDEELQRFITGKRTRGLAVVVEREDNVFLRMAREQLAAAIYPEASYALFRDHLMHALGVSEGTSEETLQTYYSVQVAEQPIIVFSRTNGETRENTSDYLVAPVRGLLSLLLMLTGLASAMYYYRDVERGTFLRLSAAKRRLLPLLCHLCALLPIAVAVLLALCVTGLLTDWGHEVGSLLLYCLAVAALCELLRKLCRSDARLGALIPVLLATMLVLCPVIMDLKILKPVQKLLPPYWYLKGSCGAQAVWPLVLYTAAAAVIAVLLPETDKNWRLEGSPVFCPDCGDQNEDGAKLCNNK